MLATVRLPLHRCWPAERTLADLSAVVITSAPQVIVRER